MPKPDYSPGALQDLDDIYDYTIENWGPKQADEYIKTLENTCIDVTNGRIVARIYTAPARIIKFYHCKHHYIFFDTLNDRTLILAILHERMDIMQKLKDRL